MPQYSAILDLSSLNGSNGFRLDGIDPDDLSGYSVAGAGDVNGDGFADIIIGAREGDPGGDSSAGETYLVFGSASAWSAAFALSTLNGTNGFRLDGIDAGDTSGRSVAAAGDVNGDGFDDLIIGANAADPGGDSAAGETYVVFGAEGGWNATFDLSSLNGTNGFRLDGIDPDDNSGWSVAGAGDVNGDGFADLIIGAYGADPGGDSFAGETYVVFGAASGWSAAFSLAGLNGSNGFRLDGIDPGDSSGYSAASAGDVNGDGFDDLIIGARGASPGGDFQAGETYVVFGAASGWNAAFDLATLNGSNGFRLDGIGANDTSGFSVASAGDVNGDGLVDLIISARWANPGGDSDAGESYVVFGAASGWSAALDLSTINGSNGFRLDGIDPADYSGTSVASAGDVNGDGFADLIIGAYNGDPGGDSAAGETYVVFGAASGWSAVFDLSALNGNNGFRLDGIDADDRSGWSVASAGDVNGDGFADLIVGAFNGDPGGHSAAGETYVVFGSAPGEAVTRTGTDIANSIRGGSFSDTLTGLGGDDILDGGAGADTLNGGAGEDRIEGGSGNDTIVGGADNDTMDGGSGDDSLQGGDGIDTASYVSATNGVTVNLATVGSQATGAGADTLTGLENLTGSVFGDSLAGTSGANVLNGLGGDDTLAGDAGADTLDGGGGFDVADYGASSSGVSLSLASGLGSAGDAQGDALVSIERVLGSGHADVLVGAASADTLEGVSGDDILQGGAGDDTLRGGIGNDQVNGGLGADVIDGGDGFDTVRYDGAASGVIIYVDAPYANTGEAAGDVLTSIEGFVGSTFNDYMVGGAANNVLQGFVGADILEGHGGDDLLDGGDGDDNLQGGLGGDILDGGAGFDVARYDGATSGVTIYVDAAYANQGEAAGDFHLSIEGIVGSTFNDYLVGGAANNILQGYVGDDILEGHDGDDLLDGGDGNDQLNGGAGGDIFDGGAGFDTVRYDGATAGVVAFMTDAWANTGEAAGDAYISIEALYGSNFNDTLAGASNSNELQGFGGTDFLYGYGGNDFLGGGTGDDFLDGGTGVDQLRGDAGDDQFVLRAGESNGDQVVDFTGNGAAAGDNLLFLGYGTAAQGATFVQIDATHWQVTSADGLIQDVITIANGANIEASDYIFGP